LIKGIDVDKISFEELKKIFRKVDNLEFIELSPYVEGIIHPKLAKKRNS